MLTNYFTEPMTRIRMRNRKPFPGKETLARRIRGRREDLQFPNIANSQFYIPLHNQWL